jgi:hypothetical protein
LPDLAETAKAAGADSLAKQITNEYLERYLYKKKIDSLTAKEMYFLGVNTTNSHQKGFTWFRDPVKSALIDKRMQPSLGPGFSRRVTDYIILKEEALNRLPKDVNAQVKDKDWKTISKAIEKKYDRTTAERVMFKAKENLFFQRKDWDSFTRITFKKLAQFGMDTSMNGRAALNNILFNVVFKNVNDRSLLGEAAEWMLKIVQMDLADSGADFMLANNIDTYANLLYKSGETEKAIEWQKRAVQEEERFAKQSNVTPRKEFAENLQKMQRGESTWTDNK